jgi:putative ABC transport system permease protein
MRISAKLIARNLLQSKSNTIINILGLTVSFTCAFAIISWVKNEFSYDRHFPESDRIYRLTFETTFSGNRLHFARCWEKWISQMPGDFPQIEELVRLRPYRHTALKIGENRFYSDRVFATDSNFFKIFGIEMLKGDPKLTLNEPYTAIISSSVAYKCFGDEDPTGKTLLLSGEQDEKMTPFTIKGVMNDTPVNSHLHFDVITSFARKDVAPDWAYVYLLLKRNTDPDDILKGLPSFIKKTKEESDHNDFKPYLQKITDIHLYSDKDREIEHNGNITNVYLFAALVVVLLLIAWVNYYNLSKVRLLVLRKQIHIQRICGSDSILVLAQSLMESFISVLAALILTVILLSLAASLASSFFGLSLLSDSYVGFITAWPLIILILLISMMAGSMPVIVFLIQSGKSFPESVVKSHNSSSRFSIYGVLVTVQLSLSIILMISALTIYREKELIFSSALGNMSSDILAFQKLNWEVRGKYTTYRNRALQNPYVKSFSASMEEPSGETLDALQVESPEIDDAHKDNPLYVLAVEDNFLGFFNILLIAGRPFSAFNPERKGEDYILNETAVKKLGWTPGESIGRPFKIKFDNPDIFYGGTVVGVARDFNFTSVKQEIKPYVMFQKPVFYNCFLVRIDSLHKAEAIESLKKIWDEEYPDYPFSYEFITDLYKTAYAKEINQAKLSEFFSMIAIIIICLGLFSVTSVLVSRRTREIGIRKANGSGIAEVMVLLNSRFIAWFAAAFIIGCPAAWFIMKKWLQSFVYKTELSWWVFGISGVVVLSVTLLTVSIKSWKAAKKNPVEALRYE